MKTNRLATENGISNIPIRVELGTAFGPLGRLLAGQDDANDEPVKSMIFDNLADYLFEFGIPGFPVVETVFIDHHRFLRVLVNDRYHAPSTELLMVLWNKDAPLGAEVVPPRQEFERWLTEILAQDDVVEDKRFFASITRFVTDAVSEIVRQHPEELFGEDQAADLLARAQLLLDEEKLATLSQLSPERLVRILRPVLELKISLAGLVGLLKEIADGLAHGEEDEEIAERLISTRAIKAVRIRINPSYLISLIHGLKLKPGEEAVSLRDSRIGQETKELFGEMCDRVFWDLGVRVPEIVFEFETDPQIVGSAFRIAVNHQFGTLYTGLVANELIVNAQPEELSYLGADVRPAFTPIIDAASIVATDRRRPFGTTRHKRFLEDKGFKPRGPIEYLTICVSHEVRRQAQCFATEATVETELALLEKSRPDLVTAAAREMAPGRLARLLRKLLREEISIRDLVGVLDRLLTYDSVAADTLNHNIFDYRLPIHPKLKLRSRDDEDNLTQYVRSGLKRAITFKNLRGSNTIDVYLLHSEIESSLLDHLAALNGVEDAVVLNAERLDQIQAAIRREAERTALGSWTPAILTSTNIRSFVRSLVADEFPGMSVLSYDELDLGPDYFIQVIAVITIP